MNNADCRKSPGHWTQPFLHPAAPLRPVFLYPSFVLPTNSPLCICSLICSKSFYCVFVSSSFSFTFSLPDLFLSPSLKALRNYSQWFFPLPRLTLSTWLIHEAHQGQAASCCSTSYIYVHPWMEMCFSAAGGTTQVIGHQTLKPPLYDHHRTLAFLKMIINHLNQNKDFFFLQ